MTATNLDDDLSDLGPPPAAADSPTEPAPAPAGPQLMYPNVDVWVTDFLANNYRRDVTEPGTPHHWCTQWWKHPEALDRLDALWRAWEALRRDPTTGPATWWIHYADPTMTALLGRDGPFTRCRRTQHAEPGSLVPPLPITVTPGGLISTRSVTGAPQQQ